MNVLEFSHKYIICGNSYPWKVIFWKWILHFPFPNICSLCYIIIDLYKIDLSKCLIYVYPNNFRMKFSVSDHCDILQGAEGKKSWFIKWCLIVLLTRHRWIDSLCCQASFWSVPGLSTVVRRCDEISNFYVGTYLSKSPDTEKLLKWRRCDVICWKDRRSKFYRAVVLRPYN